MPKKVPKRTVPKFTDKEIVKRSKQLEPERYYQDVELFNSQGMIEISTTDPNQQIKDAVRYTSLLEYFTEEYGNDDRVIGRERIRIAKYFIWHTYFDLLLVKYPPLLDLAKSLSLSALAEIESL